VKVVYFGGEFRMQHEEVGNESEKPAKTMKSLSEE
jgi:hypothetical protein